MQPAGGRLRGASVPRAAPCRAALLLWLAAGLFGSVACDERVRYSDSILLPVAVRGADASAALRADVPEDLLAALGGEIPTRWPDTLPHWQADLDLEQWVVLRHEGLGEVGKDLAAAGRGEATVRVREVRASFDPGTLNLPVVQAEIFGAPEAGEAGPSAEAAARLARLAPLDRPTFDFVPGGRTQLEATLLAPASTLGVRTRLHFDTRTRPETPAGEGTLEIEIAVDVLF
ncbi:MAG: hypothetical protein D6729_17305 [Deltaproteobacteria bacterium]|nr:MAG: hypothetical protein D6729_17305 [Deltaproteobacteria bacterium]